MSGTLDTNTTREGAPMGKDCGCGGGTASPANAAARAAAGPRFALQLPNGTKVGDYPTKSHAEIANSRVYGSKAKIVEQ
jgi:hypothetical protein